MTLLAFAGKCGFFGASGLTRAPSSAAARPSLKRPARATAPRPTPHWPKKWRRVWNRRGFTYVIVTSFPCDDFVFGIVGGRLRPLPGSRRRFPARDSAPQRKISLRTSIGWRSSISLKRGDHLNDPLPCKSIGLVRGGDHCMKGALSVALGFLITKNLRVWVRLQRPSFVSEIGPQVRDAHLFTRGSTQRQGFMDFLLL